MRFCCFLCLAVRAPRRLPRIGNPAWEGGPQALVTVCGVCGCALLASARSKTRTHTIEHTRAHTDTPALERCAVCAQHPHGRHALGAEGGLSGAAPSRQQMGHNFGDGRSSSWTRCRLQPSPPRPPPHTGAPRTEHVRERAGRQCTVTPATIRLPTRNQRPLPAPSR